MAVILAVGNRHSTAHGDERCEQQLSHIAEDERASCMACHSVLPRFLGENMKLEDVMQPSKTDEWKTHRRTVELIIPYLKKNGYQKILCPFDEEDSYFVIVLREHGFDVTCSHIATGTDFFDIDNLSDFDAIVSNPPFSKRQEVLYRLFEVDVPFAIIVNFIGLFDSKVRYDLFKNNEFELLIPNGRIKFFNENMVGKTPNFQSIYVCKKMATKQIEFIGI